MNQTEKKRFIVAIDGPSGAGKSSVAKLVAEKLGYRFLDTGAMYRAVAWKAMQLQVSSDDSQALAELTRSVKIEFNGNPSQQKVYCNGEDVSEAIRKPEIGDLASKISTFSEVRKALVEQQQRIGSEGGIVAEGRDQTTVVFPHAEVKVYLTASAEERARRRALELTLKGICVSYEAILSQQKERDERDMTRADSPLRVSDTAVVIDSEGMTQDEVVEKVLELCRK